MYNQPLVGCIVINISSTLSAAGCKQTSKADLIRMDIVKKVGDIWQGFGLWCRDRSQQIMSALATALFQSYKSPSTWVKALSFSCTAHEWKGANSAIWTKLEQKTSIWFPIFFFTLLYLISVLRTAMGGFPSQFVEESVTDAWFPIIKGSAGMLRKRKHLQCSHI